MKKLLFFAIITLFYACKTKEVVTPNRPPSAFTVTPTLKTDGKTIVLNWTKAKDPDGDAVTYAVVLKDTLVKNSGDTTYTIANLDFNYSQTGKIIAKDAKGLTTEVSFMATTKSITFVSIPDAIFEKFLVDSKIDKDGQVNGRMNVDEAKGISKLVFSTTNILSVAGIEAFTDLEELNCSGQVDIGPTGKLTLLDVSKCTALKKLNCSANRLANLDLSKNINLQNLDCGFNRLSSLELSKNINLQALYCDLNALKSLDLSSNTNLQLLNCQNNQLTNLALSKNLKLQTLLCSINQLASLDISKNTLLSDFICYNNQLNALDLSNNSALKKIDCYLNPITNLDISKNTALIQLVCYSTKLAALDVSKNILLEQLLCFSNNIKTICVADVAKAKANTGWSKDVTATYEVCK